MDADGRLGSERLTIADHEFAAGDRVVCLRNSHRLGVKNGTRGTSNASTANAGRSPSPPTAARPSNSPAPTSQAGNVRHAYALTGHAAQGLTVERAFVLGAGEARLQEWGYVALSRARTETRLYVTGKPREHESHFHDLDDRDPLTRFGRALEESAAEELAVDQRPLTSGPRHEARPEIERPELTTNQAMRRRLLERKRGALQKTREVAERQLGAAEDALDRCGGLRRGRREPCVTRSRSTDEGSSQSTPSSSGSRHIEAITTDHDGPGRTRERSHPEQPRDRQILGRSAAMRRHGSISHAYGCDRQRRVGAQPASRSLRRRVLAVRHAAR